MLRGGAVLLVLIYHVSTYAAKAGGVGLLDGRVGFGAAGVDLFFVISGFIMIKIADQKRGVESPVEFLRRRAIRIYPLYWFFTLIAWGIFAIYPSLANRPGGAEEVSLIYSLLLWPQKFAPLVGQGWTLIHEMYFYVVFAFVLLARERNRSKWLFAWALSVFVVAYWVKSPGVDLILSRSEIGRLVFNPLTLEFLGGCLLAVHHSRRAPQPGGETGKWLFWGGFVLLVLVGGGMRDSISFEFPRELAYGVPALLILMGATRMEADAGFQGPRWMRLIGDASYSIYLSHIFTLSGCLLVFRRLPLQGGSLELLAIIVMVLASLVVGFLTYRFVELPMISWARRIHWRKPLVEPS